MTDASKAAVRFAVSLIGEFLREAAVLLAVFLPLDWAVQGRPLTTSFVAATVVVVLGLLGTGIVLSLKGRPQEAKPC